MSDKKAGPAEIAMYQVRLGCEAAPEIGCGLRAKPVLQDLERVPGIHEAWLSRAGNLIAVVRSVTESGNDEADPSVAVFRKHRITAEALRGALFAKALNDFASRFGWHRGTEVDRLSEEEAHIIAARLVGRLRSRASLPGLETITLEKAVAEACAHELIQNPEQSPAARKRRLAGAALGAARLLLNPSAFTAFTLAVRLGHRALSDER